MEGSDRGPHWHFFPLPLLTMPMRAPLQQTVASLGGHHPGGSDTLMKIEIFFAAELTTTLDNHLERWRGCEW